MPTRRNAIGAHVSIAGGITNAPARAHEERCETFQCFTRSPQGGPAPKITDEIAAQFRAEMERYGMDTFCIHAPYYINLASLRAPIRHGSAKVLREELERGSLLGANFVMFHPGSSAGQERSDALESVHKGIARILEGYTGTTELLIEISAGAGSVVADTFDEVGALVSRAKHYHGFGGVCFDTCHAFASGYDFRTPAGVKSVLKEFDTSVGLEWLAMTHVNDSKTELGGKKDRHEHIGHGHIGKEGIEAILSTPAFRKINWILETEPEGRARDLTVLSNIRSLGGLVR